MLAKAAMGIMFKIPGMVNTQTISNKPCKTVDAFVFAPALTFADERTTTEVTGNPPINAESMLPVPCAYNSRFAGLMRFSGSSLSAASRLNKVSSEATTANVTAVTQTL
jgi:hypothetical protein